jgi:hypothetical protein
VASPMPLVPPMITTFVTLHPSAEDSHHFAIALFPLMRYISAHQHRDGAIFGTFGPH